jgi:hypothetical protein
VWCDVANILGSLDSPAAGGKVIPARAYPLELTAGSEGDFDMNQHEYVRQAYLSLAAITPNPGMTDDVRRALRKVLDDLERALFQPVRRASADDADFAGESEGPTNPLYGLG